MSRVRQRVDSEQSRANCHVREGLAVIRQPSGVGVSERVAVAGVG